MARTPKTREMILKPIKGLDGPEQPRQPSPAATAISKAALKLVEYTTGALIFTAMCAVVAFTVMYALNIMHRHEPAVPPFGFWFLWAAIWGSSVLALFAGNLVKLATAEE